VRFYWDDFSPWRMQLQTGRTWTAGCQGQTSAWSGHPCRETPASLLPEDLASADMVHEIMRRSVITEKFLSW